MIDPTEIMQVSAYAQEPEPGFWATFLALSAFWLFLGVGIAAVRALDIRDRKWRR